MVIRRCCRHWTAPVSPDPGTSPTPASLARSWDPELPAQTWSSSHSGWQQLPGLIWGGREITIQMIFHWKQRQTNSSVVNIFEGCFNKCLDFGEAACRWKVLSHVVNCLCVPRTLQERKNNSLVVIFAFSMFPKRRNLGTSHPHLWEQSSFPCSLGLKRSSIFIDPYLTLANCHLAFSTLFSVALFLSRFDFTLHLHAIITWPLSSQFSVTASSLIFEACDFLLVISNIPGDSKKDCVGGHFKSLSLKPWWFVI